MFAKRIGIFLAVLMIFSAVAVSAADSVTIINKTGYAIFYLKISPTSADDWGDDWLGDEVLADGENITLDLAAAGYAKQCTFDIKAVDEDDDSYIQWEVDLCSRSKVVLTMDDYVVPDDEGSGVETDCGYTQDISIRNDTGFDIWYVYISPTDSDDWGEDRLGDEVIMDGDSFTICMPGYGSKCQFDVKIVDSDGDDYVKMDVNLCSIESLTFTLDDLSTD